MADTVPVLLAAAGPGPAQVRQSAVYGLGVLAQHHPSGFTPVAGQAVQALLAMLGSGAAHAGLANGDRYTAGFSSLTVLGPTNPCSYTPVARQSVLSAEFHPPTIS